MDQILIEWSGFELIFDHWQPHAILVGLNTNTQVHTAWGMSHDLLAADDSNT